MMQMTRVEVEAWVRRGIAECGGIMAYARRHVWTPYTLRLVGLPEVQVVAEPVATAVPVRAARPYQPMWRLGDWPRGMR